MKRITLCILLCMTITSCGNRNTSNKPLEYTVHEDLSARPTEYARDISDVGAILRDAAQRGFLQDYHNTKWFNQRQQYLCTSRVIDAQTFKMVMQ